ncbi:MAG: hypothetical protein V2A55_03240 [Candidatus Jorgensenbacteria bacterium]
MATILIKGGLVYDGSGNEPVKEDILIRGERILRRGNFPKNRGDSMIDAIGAMVLPGFVNVNSSADHYLDIFDDNFGEDCLKDGVTTIIGGNCGASLLPATASLFLPLRKWGGVSSLSANWHDFDDVFRRLNKKLNINFGTLVGHSTIRRALVGDETRDLTENELRAAKRMLDHAFQKGAFGFSTGLEFIHTKLTPVHEIEELAEVASEKKRVYATHLRSYGPHLGAAVEEAIKIAKKTGVNLEISHFTPRVLEARNYSVLKDKIEEESAKLRISFDCNSLSHIPATMYQFLPEWLKDGNLETVLEHLKSEHLEKRILEYLRRLGGEDIHIGEMPSHLSFLSGKSLRSYAISNKLKPAEALLKLMKISRLRGVLLRQAADDVIDDFVFSSASLIASGEARGGKPFFKFLRLAEKTKKISMEKAVAKLTALPAEKYKLKGRGRILEDYYADLLVVRDFKVKNAIVNGAVLVDEGVFQNSRSGKFLKYER